MYLARGSYRVLGEGFVMLEPRGCPTPGACSCPPRVEALRQHVEQARILLLALRSAPGLTASMREQILKWDDALAAQGDDA